MSIPQPSRLEFDRIRSLDCAPEIRASLFADLCRLSILAMIQRAGSGHYGSSFSGVDLMAWLFLNELRPGPTPGAPPRDVFFSSKGHDAPALYSVMAGVGLLDAEALAALRRLDGLPGHPDVGTPGIITNTGSLGMGISKAKGLALANRLQGRDSRIFVMLGDGELQEGQIWESLGQAAHRRLGEITVVIDANGIQSDTWVEDTSPLGDVEAKFRAFGWRTCAIDGHDPASMRQAFASAGSAGDIPLAILARTEKGHGVSFMRYRPEGGELYAYHSGALSAERADRAFREIRARIDAGLERLGLTPLGLEPSSGDARSPGRPENPQRLVDAYAAALVTLGREREDLVVLDADLKKDCGLLPFEAAFPERFIECGIAEQDMVSTAGGLALGGLFPAVHSFACFLTPRANEQIYNNAGEGSRILYVGSLAGLLPAGPGHSHQGVRDISVMAAVPGMTVAVPSCEAEVSLLVRRLAEGCGPGYLRLFSMPWDIPYALPEDYDARPGCGCVLRQGTDAALIAYGPVMLSQAWDAAALLGERHSLSVRVVNCPWPNRVDADWLAEATSGVGLVAVAEDHYVIGGLRDLISPSLLALRDRGRSFRFVSMGLEGMPCCGRPDEVLRRHGLDAESLADKLHRHIAR
ncbi:MAG: transketolase C-terminal domain-containing protein [Pseudodesulfovibrio sp.]